METVWKWCTAFNSGHTDADKSSNPDAKEYLFINTHNIIVMTKNRPYILVKLEKSVTDI